MRGAGTVAVGPWQGAREKFAGEPVAVLDSGPVTLPGAIVGGIDIIWLFNMVQHAVAAFDTDAIATEPCCAGAS